MAKQGWLILTSTFSLRKGYERQVLSLYFLLKSYTSKRSSWGWQNILTGRDVLKKCVWWHSNSLDMVVQGLAYQLRTSLFGKISSNSFYPIRSKCFYGVFY